MIEPQSEYVTCRHFNFGKYKLQCHIQNHYTVRVRFSCVEYYLTVGRINALGAQLAKSFKTILGFSYIR